MDTDATFTEYQRRNYSFPFLNNVTACKVYNLERKRTRRSPIYTEIIYSKNIKKKKKMSKAGKLRVGLLIKQKRKGKSNSTSTALFIEHDSNKRAINKKGYVWFPRNCRKIKKNQEYQHSFSTNNSFFVLSFFEKLKKGCKKLNFLEKQTRKR